MTGRRLVQERGEIDLKDIMEYLICEIGHYCWPALPASQRIEQVAQLCGLEAERVMSLLQHATAVSEDDLYAALVVSANVRDSYSRAADRLGSNRRRIVLALLNDARRRMMTKKPGKY